MTIYSMFNSSTIFFFIQLTLYDSYRFNNKIWYSTLEELLLFNLHYNEYKYSEYALFFWEKCFIDFWTKLFCVLRRLLCNNILAFIIIFYSFLLIFNFRWAKNNFIMSNSTSKQFNSILINIYKNILQSKQRSNQLKDLMQSFYCISKCFFKLITEILLHFKSNISDCLLIWLHLFVISYFENYCLKFY